MSILAELNSGFTPTVWNRKTVADGDYLQNMTIGPIFSGEQFLANQIDLVKTSGDYSFSYLQDSAANLNSAYTYATSHTGNLTISGSYNGITSNFNYDGTTNVTAGLTDIFTKISDDIFSRITYKVVDDTAAILTDKNTTLIYLIAQSGASPDSYYEYIYDSNTSAAKMIGDTSLALSGYATKTELSTETDSRISGDSALSANLSTVSSNVSTISSNLSTLSSNFVNVSSIVSANSANWNTAYTWVHTNSAQALISLDVYNLNYNTKTYNYSTGYRTSLINYSGAHSLSAGGSNLQFIGYLTGTNLSSSWVNLGMLMPRATPNMSADQVYVCLKNNIAIENYNWLSINTLSFANGTNLLGGFSYSGSYTGSTGTTGVNQYNQVIKLPCLTEVFSQTKTTASTNYTLTEEGWYDIDGTLYIKGKTGSITDLTFSYDMTQLITSTYTLTSDLTNEIFSHEGIDEKIPFHAKLFAITGESGSLVINPNSVSAWFSSASSAADFNSTGTSTYAIANYIITRRNYA